MNYSPVHIVGDVKSTVHRTNGHVGLVRCICAEIEPKHDNFFPFFLDKKHVQKCTIYERDVFIIHIFTLFEFFSPENWNSVTKTNKTLKDNSYIQLQEKL